MYQEPVVLHIGSPDPKADGLVMVFADGQLLDPEQSMSPGSGHYRLENKKKIHFQPQHRPEVGTKITVVFESTSGWRREYAVIK